MKVSCRRRSGWLAMMIGLLFCLTALAQEPSPQPLFGPAVRLSLIVTDRSDHSVDDARQDEFQVLENKVPQSLSVFQKDESPVDYVLAIDASGSFRGKLVPALEAAKMLFEGNRTSDQALLIRFISSDKIAAFSNFTSDKAELIDKLKLFKTEMGQSAVIDALYVAVQAATEHDAANSTVRRAVILISDGEDRASYHNTDALVKLLQRTNVQVFVIGIVTQLDDQKGLIRTSPRAAAEALLKRVAEVSGGRVFFPRNDSEILRASAEIAHDLHTQYVFSYQSTNPDLTENFRKIEIQIVKTAGQRSLTAITRPGYFLTPPPDPTAKEKKKSKG